MSNKMFLSPAFHVKPLTDIRTQDQTAFSGLPTLCWELLLCFSIKPHLITLQKKKEPELSLKKIVYGCFACVSLCVLCVCPVPREARRGHQIPLNWSFRWL